MASTKATPESSRQWVVYALKCPATGDVRYIGWTFNIAKRLKSHAYTAQKFDRYRDCWIRKVMACGLFPASEIVEQGTGDWAAAERKWISHYRREGARLTNLTDGGEGVPGLRHSAEAIERIRQKKTGRKMTPEERRKHSLALMGRVVSSTTREKISQANSGKRRTPEQRARLSEALKGRKGKPLTPAQRAAHSARLKEYWAQHPDLHRGRQVIDISGQRFGRLVAVQFVAVNSDGKAEWDCQCDCGNTVTTTSDRLRHGGKDHCGCLSVEREASRAEQFSDLYASKHNWIGHEVGLLSVVDLEPFQPGSRGRWRCVCECGGQRFLSAAKLASGAVKSCGCLKKRSIGDRFWRRVTKSKGCWLWKGKTTREGYGHFTAGKKKMRPAVASYELCIGPVPKGKCVLASCDNPLCVNPDHLVIAEPKDRSAKMVRQRRHEYGEKRYSAKLSNRDVLEILRRYRSGEKGVDLAREFGVTKNCVSSIVNGHNWNLVTGLPRKRRSANSPDRLR